MDQPGGRGKQRDPPTPNTLCGPAAGPRLLPVKIYTRTGDDGSTSLLGPGRVLKSDGRVEAYGCVDELNATLGTVRTSDSERWLDSELAAIQARLFHIGAELAASTPEAVGSLERIGEADVTALEASIDRLEQDLPPLRSFVLPGGTAFGASLHLARTVCRRAERRVVALAQQGPVEPRVIRYLNRLADLLFVMARWANRRAGVDDVEWRGGR